MHPVILSIGPVSIYSYGLMLAIAFITAVYLASKRARFYNIPEQEVSSLAITLLISGIIGARIAYIIANLGDFAARPLTALMINRGGLVFYGGFILAFIAGAVFVRIKRLPALDTADLVAPFIALGHSIGRIGCFLNGCCFGKPTECLLGVRFPNTFVKVYPTQLFSFAGLLLIFFLLLFMQKRRAFKGEVILLYIIIYGIFRFCIDFLRGDLTPVFYGFTATQVISILFISAGAAVFVLVKILKKRQDI